MIEQKFGPKRCRDTRKPRADQCPGVVFYRYRGCNSLSPVTRGQALLEKKILCCNEETERLAPTDAQGAEELLELSYQITSSYNDNTVKVSWKTKRQECVPQWIYLKIFTGDYLKYMAKEKRSPMVSALADTGALCYCDEGSCLECASRCERDFAVYVYSKGTGLLEVPLDRMATHWQTQEKETEEQEDFLLYLLMN